VVKTRPIDYQLPPECTYTGDGQNRDGITTWWPIRCPTGLPWALLPSLGAQGWDYCGCAGVEGCHYRTKEWLLLVKVDVFTGTDTAPTGEIGERPRAARPGLTPSECGSLPSGG